MSAMGFTTVFSQGQSEARRMRALSVERPRGCKIIHICLIELFGWIHFALALLSYNTYLWPQKYSGSTGWVCSATTLSGSDLGLHFTEVFVLTTGIVGCDHEGGRRAGAPHRRADLCHGARAGLREALGQAAPDGPRPQLHTRGASPAHRPRIGTGQQRGGETQQ
eukprot:scaffold349675_cov46-Prasinocladus_malaysianus.AAC.1